MCCTGGRETYDSGGCHWDAEDGAVSLEYVLMAGLVAVVVAVAVDLFGVAVRDLLQPAIDLL